MAFVRTLLRKFVRNKRKIQEEHDVWRLYHLLYYFEQSGGKEVKVARPQNVSYHEQYRTVHSAVTKQLISRLESVSAAPPPTTTTTTTIAPTPTSTGSNTAPTSTGPNTGLTALRLHRCCPYRPGNISGVRLSGLAVAGTVICFFPGTVYVPTDLEDMADFPEIGKANPYLMSLSDGSVIDAMPYASSDGAGRGVLAEGHMIRHPQPGQESNIMPFSYNVDPSFPKDLLPLIPNKYYKHPGLLYYSQSPMRTLVFVATRHIRDEELLLNYRLHPDSQLPSWYSSLDTEEARQRWSY